MFTHIYTHIYICLLSPAFWNMATCSGSAGQSSLLKSPSVLKPRGCGSFPGLDSGDSGLLLLLLVVVVVVVVVVVEFNHVVVVE